MRMKKRIFSFALAVLMVVCLLPATALAADIVDSGTCGGKGSNLTWRLDSDGTLTISGTGRMNDYSSGFFDGNGAPWKTKGIQTVVIENGVTSIGGYAFYDCANLTDVVIPDSVTSIGSNAFYGCATLAGIVIPDSVDNINPGAFSDCSGLTSVVIPDSVGFIQYATFSGCSSLTSVVIPDSVTSIEDSAFNGCTNITDITIPDSVTRIGDHTFYDCSSLTGITIPDRVDSIGDFAFSGCTSLTAIAIAAENPYFCSLDGVLYSKDQKTIIAYPAGRPDAAFAIPEGVTKIGNSAFSGCTNLTEIFIPDGVTDIGDSAFSECTNLIEITIPNGVTSIGDYAFSGYDYTELVPMSLTSITLPDSLISIGECAFWNCTELESITIPDSVMIIGCDAFSDCRSLKSIAIPNGVANIENGTFCNCERLESVTIPDTVTAVKFAAFEGCSNLKDVYFLGTKEVWQKVAFYQGNDTVSKNAVVHYFSEWTSEKKPTCTEPGWEMSTCPEADCGKIFTRKIPALGHAWDDGVVTKPASETETGIMTFTCPRCGATRTETIPVLPHVHSYKDVVTAPTCTAKGYTTHTCTCGDSYVDTYVRALGHAWDDGVVTKPATATETGVKIFACTRCDATKTETIPMLPHNHSYKAFVTAPTCTLGGYTTHTCACGTSYVDTFVNALGHSWNDGVVTKPATATEAGVKAFVCTRCSATKTETIPAGSCPSAGFTDVPGEGNWAHAGIDYCVANGLMSGVGSGRFAPKMTTTRAQIVQILYNLEGEPKVSGTMPFTDLTQNWYKDAVLWAYQTGVVSGTSATTFAPDQPVTREQIAVILMGYAEKVLGVTRTWMPADLSVYPDAGSVSGWAKDALADAVALGLISGASNGGAIYLNPKGSATREQVATILMEFCKNVKK